MPQYWCLCIKCFWLNFHHMVYSIFCFRRMVSIEQWRSAIAGADHRQSRILDKKQNVGTKSSTSPALIPYWAAIIAVILIISGVEKNPGPNSDTAENDTRVNFHTYIFFYPTNFQLFISFMPCHTIPSICRKRHTHQISFSCIMGGE